VIGKRQGRRPGKARTRRSTSWSASSPAPRAVIEPGDGTTVRSAPACRTDARKIPCWQHGADLLVSVPHVIRDQAIDEWYHEYSPGVLYHLAGAFASFSDALQPLA